MNSVSPISPEGAQMREGTTNAAARPGSPWRELLAVCSLPGILVAPLAVLHNQPWVEFVGYCADYSFEDGSLALQLALPFEIVFGAFLATLAVVIVRPAPRRAEPTFVTSGRPVLDSLFVALPTLMPMLVRMVRGCAILAPVWFAALIGGVVAARYLPFMPIDASLMHITKWYVLYNLPLWVGDGSLGVFCLLGISLLAISGLRRPEVAPRWLLAIWVVVASALGYQYSLNLHRHMAEMGLGSFGPFIHVFYRGLYFAWGSGTAAYLLYRFLRRGDFRATRDSVTDAGLRDMR